MGMDWDDYRLVQEGFEHGIAEAHEAFLAVHMGRIHDHNSEEKVSSPLRMLQLMDELRKAPTRWIIWNLPFRIIHFQRWPNLPLMRVIERPYA